MPWGVTPLASGAVAPGRGGYSPDGTKGLMSFKKMNNKTIATAIVSAWIASVLTTITTVTITVLTLAVVVLVAAGVPRREEQRYNTYYYYR